MSEIKTEKQVLKVEGMTCANCALGISKTLENHGFSDVLVDFTTGDVEFSPQTNGDSPEKLIKKMGYRVVSEGNDQEKPFWTIDRKFYFSLIFSVPLFMHMFVDWAWLNNPWIQALICLPVFILGVLHFGRSGWGSLKAGVPNMDVLIIIGATAAFGYSLTGAILKLGHEYLFFETASTIISLVLLGNLIEKRSVSKTGVALRELMALRPEKAKKVDVHEGKEHIHEVDAKSLVKGDLIEVNLGDKVPVDGVIVSGKGIFNEASLTGENRPVSKSNGDRILGGSILDSGQVRMMAEQVGEETVIARVIDLVKSAQRNKPNIQSLGDKISAIFVPVVVGIAVLTFLITFFIADGGIRASILSAVAVLVISCPCAMGLATPTAVAVGIGRSASEGILIKGGSVLEDFSQIKTVFFDKTGTLTTGDFKITDFTAFEGDDISAQGIIKTLEEKSNHPIAISLFKAFADVEPVSLEDIHEIKGEGMSGKSPSGDVFKISSTTKMDEGLKSFDGCLTKNGKPIAAWKLGDDVKSGAKELIQFFKAKGIHPVLLSGDRKENCDKVASLLEIETVYSQKLPHEKLEILKSAAKTQKIAMVGDGVNDAPSLASATVGISLGNASKIAMDASGIILLKDDLFQLQKAFSISAKTLQTIKQNLFWAFSYNLVAIPIAAFGMLNPMVAALSMAFSDVMVIGNSLRLKVRKIG
ncbi:MAG: Cu+-exporting ATPase [Sphingobacteriales bacterium]|jgi:Cu+-exporting ATPase